MEIKQIKELMLTMEKFNIAKIRIKNGDMEVELEKNRPLEEAHYHTHKMEPSSQESMVKHKHSLPTSHKEESKLPQKEDAQYITAPMVGTFYATPSPEKPAFIQMGQQIHAEDVVCIIEAMKVMNEIKAGATGKILEVLVPNGHPVEYGTKLFKIT